MNLKIKVRLMPDAGKLRARASVSVYDEETGFQMTSHGFRVIDGGEKPPWVGDPQERYFVGDVSKYKKMVDLNASAREEIHSEILRQYQKLKEEG